jgi:hypothetical protein
MGGHGVARQHDPSSEIMKNGPGMNPSSFRSRIDNLASASGLTA